jgi:fucose permease
MFRGPATLMRTNSLMKWVFAGAVAACLLAVAAALVVPRDWKLIAVMAIGLAMLIIYPTMLSRALKPAPVSVALYVDPTGIYADDAPLALR